jgi:gamma-glutamyl hydrolase
MIKVAVVAILLGLCLSAAVPQNPVIGVYTQIDEYDEPSTKELLSTYISAAYVKYVWMSGAQVVPIYAFSNQSDIEAILRKVNGVLFTGGAGEDEIHIDNHWVKNANFILQFAIAENQRGNVFPVWGTCLGLELLTYLTSGFDESALQPIRGSAHMLNVLNFIDNSVLFDDLNANLRNKLTTAPGILYFNHEVGLKLTSFRANRRLLEFWRVAASTTSP